MKTTGSVFMPILVIVLLSCARGFYLYQYMKRDTALSREVIREIRSLGCPIEQDVRMVILRTRDGLIDAPHW